MKKIIKKNGLVIYQAKDGAIELRGDFGNETIWATQAQITDIFDIDRTVVTKHIGNVLQSKEVDEKSNVQKMHIANSDKLTILYSCFTTFSYSAECENVSWVNGDFCVPRTSGVP